MLSGGTSRNVEARKHRHFLGSTGGDAPNEETSQLIRTMKRQRLKRIYVGTIRRKLHLTRSRGETITGCPIAYTESEESEIICKADAATGGGRSPRGCGPYGEKKKTVRISMKDLHSDVVEMLPVFFKKGPSYGRTGALT